VLASEHVGIVHGGVANVGLPDSHEHTVIAPDLSNLPPGQRAVDPRDRSDEDPPAGS
jgi:hypothetical protein